MLVAGCVGHTRPASGKKKSESYEKQEEERWFCTHSQNEYPSFISRSIIPHILKFIVYFLGGDGKMKKRVVFSVLCLLTIFGTAVQATVVVFLLDDPVQYEREIGPVQITEHSAVDIYVENVEAPQRWKDWKSGERPEPHKKPNREEGGTKRTAIWLHL